jgi:hypothetical protein
MMQVVLLGMRKSLGEDAGVLDPVTDLLGEALQEPLANLPPERVAKLVRRSKRVTEQAFAPVVGKLFGVQYLTIARFTADLAERGVLVVGSEPVLGSEMLSSFLSHFPIIISVHLQLLSNRDSVRFGDSHSSFPAHLFDDHKRHSYAFLPKELT